MSDIKLYNGDCLKVMDELIEQGIKVDAIITDPPYGMGYSRHIAKPKYNKLINDSNLLWIDDCIDKAYLLANNNAYVFMFCSWHNIDIFKTSFERKFHLKNILIWDKGGNGMGDLKTNFGNINEFILFGVKQINKLKQKPLNGKRECNMLKFSRSGNKFHPTEKPLDLMEYLINKTTKENDWVLDMFMGSGATGVACKNTNRNFIGIELDKNYYEIAKKRIDDEMQLNLCIQMKS